MGQWSGRDWFLKTSGRYHVEEQKGHLDDARLKDYQVNHDLFQEIDRIVFE